MQVVGLPVAVAGSVVTVGKLLGLAAPALAGRFVDRFGPRQVVIASQVLQAVGTFVYLVAGDAVTVLVASALLAAGQQAFYSSVFAMIADTVQPGDSTDSAFAVVGAVRGSCFGLGGLVGGALTAAGPAALRVAVAVDGVTFLAAAAVLLLFLHVSHVRHDREQAVSVLRNRPYLVLIIVTALGSLASDVFLEGISVYVIEVLRGPSWVAGTMVTVLTISGIAFGAIVVRWTRSWWRTTGIRIGYVITAVWAVVSLGAVLVPPPVLPPYLLGTSVLLAAALIIGNRVNALAEAAAPRATRGRYMAAFQYAFTAAGIAAPGVVALFAVGPWLPWLVSAVAATVAAAAVPYLTKNLPEDAVRGRQGTMAST
ncbi:MFS transporter [Kutzneria buriramensis]|uniref:MFS transporter n=2 Tax=Kutzneria buriramensis TaxID=1045776 RepID=A0A3E0HPG6_9PSEU|nr:MFS transporter [Kutzneria buriramensis]